MITISTIFVIFASKLNSHTMEEIIKLNSIQQYNQMYGLETQHPLIAVIDLSKATIFPTHFTLNYGVYALFLKQTKCGDLRYGRQTYDYQEGTVTSFAPGQIVEVNMPEGTRPIARNSIPSGFNSRDRTRSRNQTLFFLFIFVQ